MKRLEKPKFKIIPHWGWHTYDSCAICGGKNIRHGYSWEPNKEHFLIDKYAICDQCGYEYAISEGSIGVTWIQYWDFSKDKNEKS